MTATYAPVITYCSPKLQNLRDESLLIVSYAGLLTIFGSRPNSFTPNRKYREAGGDAAGPRYHHRNFNFIPAAKHLASS
jgi:hypothetical protein